MEGLGCFHLCFNFTPNLSFLEIELENTLSGEIFPFDILKVQNKNEIMSTDKEHSLMSVFYKWLERFDSL